MITRNEWIESGPKEPDPMEAVLASEGITRFRELGHDWPSLDAWVQMEKLDVEFSKRHVPDARLIPHVPLSEISCRPLSDIEHLAHYFALSSRQRSENRIESFLNDRRVEKLSEIQIEFDAMGFKPGDCTLEEFARLYGIDADLSLSFDGSGASDNCDALAVLGLDCFEQLDANANQRCLMSVLVAEVGDFKDGRGHFDTDSIRRIVELGNAEPKGLLCRLGHPSPGDDRVTGHLGRFMNFRVDADGLQARADLIIADVAMEEPIGGGKPIGQYVIQLANEDSGALGSSLVVRSQKTSRDNLPMGFAPPLWTPVEIKAIDIVSDGNATHSELLNELAAC